MRRTLLLSFLTVSTLALAQVDGPPPDEAAGAERWQAHKQQRLQSVVQALGLDAAGAQRLSATFASFEPRQKALHQQMKAQGQVLHRAAEGDATAAGQVDAAIAQLRALRQQGEALHEEMFAQLSQGLTAQQKAQLVLALRPGHSGHGRHARGMAPAQP